MWVRIIKNCLWKFNCVQNYKQNETNNINSCKNVDTTKQQNIIIIDTRSIYCTAHQKQRSKHRSLWDPGPFQYKSTVQMCIRYAIHPRMRNDLYCLETGRTTCFSWPLKRGMHKLTPWTAGRCPKTFTINVPFSFQFVVLSIIKSLFNCYESACFNTTCYSKVFSNLCS